MPNPWLYRLRADARLRLFCLPFAGGASAAFAAWGPALAPDIEVCPVLLPGREMRLQEPAIHDMDRLITALADGLQHALDRPYALLGYSLGSVVAFELIRELRRRGLPAPVRLIVVSRGAPQFSDRVPIAHLAGDAFVAALQTRYNAIPAPILANRELMAMFTPILRADFTLLEAYRMRPEPPIAAPIAAWFGDDDQAVIRDQVAAWADHTTAQFELHALPAGHFFHADRRLIDGVARLLRSPA